MADIVYQVKILDIAGTVLGTLGNAYVTSVVWELNGFGSAAFTVPTFDCPTYLAVPQVEVQIWRDRGDGGGSILIWWGVVVRARATPVSVEFQCAGLLWYFSRRYCGPILHNYITNGGFDVDLAGWTAVGCTMTRDTTLTRAGVASMQLIGSGGGADDYAYATFSVTTGSAEPLALFAAADFFVTTAPLDPAYLGRGIVIEGSISGVVQAGGDNLIDGSNNYAPGTWTRIVASALIVPVSTTWDITVKLYSPGGQINWDQVVVRAEESTGSNIVPGTVGDLNTLIGNVVAYAQDAGSNKSDLRIGGPTGTLGADIYRQYQFYDQAEIWAGVLQPLVAEGRCDIDIVWPTGGATRSIQAWVTKGAATGITLGIDSNVGDFSIDVDGQATASTVTVKGQGAAPIKMIPPVLDQTEQTVCDVLGYTYDLTANGGLVLEAVESAPVEVLPDGIQAQAVTDQARLKNPVTVPTLTVKEQTGVPLVGVLAVGDTVTAAVNYGWAQLSGTWRIVAMTLDPATETLQVVLNIPVAGAGKVAPHVMSLLAANRQETADLVRHTLPQPPPRPADIIFSAPGPLLVSTSPPVTPKTATTVVGISVTLGTAGTSTTTVALLRNGTSVATVNLGSGDTYAHTFAVPAVGFAGRGHNYALSATAAGTGSADLGGSLELA